jgi:small subunit ribosomal protein S13
MRLAGVNIPDNKKAEIALTYIYGIGRTTAEKLLVEAGIDRSKRARELTAQEVAKLKTLIENRYKIEGELRQLVRQNINRLKQIKTYRGIRHGRRLPVRGQRTRTNSRTVRGNVRLTAGSGKRKLTKT